MINNSNSYILNFDKCNQKCLFCMKSEDIKSGYNFSYDIFAKEIINAKKRGYRNIDFFGGEPTCFSFLKETIKLVNDLKMTATLATNAVKFSSHKYADYLFSGTDIKGIRTSLHSYRPEVHDVITQKHGSFNKTIKGIKNILKYNKRLSVNIVITSLNYKELPRITSFIYKLGVRGIKFSGMLFKGRAVDERWLVIDLSSVSPYLSEAIYLSKNLGFYLIECERLPMCILKKRTIKIH